jgi:SAM-dependent methyltransferase
MKHSIDWNTDLWNNSAHVPENGEGWSGPFGDSETQWQCVLKPRLRACLPARRILEIACGWGRWTGFLIPEAQHYTGVDIAEAALQSCSAQHFFAIKRGQARFYANDGKSLDFVPTGGVDFVFSFDSLVHASMDAIEGYLNECARVLSTGGKAFLHHSNMQQYAASRDVHDLSVNPHGRSPFVSAELVHACAIKYGLTVISQEKLCWQSDMLNDCFTVVGKTTSHNTIYLDNWAFDAEAQRSKQLYDMYKERS